MISLIEIADTTNSIRLLIWLTIYPRSLLIIDSQIDDILLIPTVHPVPNPPRLSNPANYFIILILYIHEAFAYRYKFLLIFL